jgi:hypothetical protein
MMKKLLLLGVLLVGGATICLAQNDWELLNDEDGIKVWRRDVENSPIVALKGEAIIDAPIAKVANVLDDTTRKTEWVCNGIEAKNIRTISPTERVEYNVTSAPWPIRNRDFVFHAQMKCDRTAKTLVFELRSVNDPLMPVDENKAVRGELLDSSYTLTQLDAKHTRLVVEIQADPKGSVPKWVVNLFQKSWPRKTIEGIRAQCAKGDVGELALATQLLAPPQYAIAAVTSLTKKK